MAERQTDEAASEAFELPLDSAAAHLEAIAKGINDVDTLIQGLLAKVPPAKPWQRQLLQQLAEADRHVEILRLTIYLEHDAHEIWLAAEQLRLILQTAQMQVAFGRADSQTKAAVQVAARMTGLVSKLLAG